MAITPNVSPVSGNPSRPDENGEQGISFVTRSGDATKISPDPKGEGRISPVGPKDNSKRGRQG